MNSMVKKMKIYFKHRKNLKTLLKIYKKKKKGFTCDKIMNWATGVSKNDIKVEKIRVELSNGKEAIYCLYAVNDFAGHVAYGLKYDLLGFVGIKLIRQCSFSEFLDLYGTAVLEGID
jgi:hypothetical protein